MKISITLNCPIEFKRIKNGERVIYDKCPAEIDFDVVDEDIKGKSPLEEINKLLNEYQSGMRRDSVQR